MSSLSVLEEDNKQYCGRQRGGAVIDPNDDQYGHGSQMDSGKSYESNDLSEVSNYIPNDNHEKSGSSEIS